MPFIRTSTNIKISDEKLNIIKERYGKAISLLGKPESYLMLEFDDERKMFFGGNNNPLTMIDVKLLGSVNNSEAFTSEVTKIINEELGISPSNIYVCYKEYSDWGFQGHNF